MLKKYYASGAVAIAAACLFSACSPQYNWRDYRGTDAPYTVQFPGKPESLSRMIDLDGIQVNMTMTAAEIDGVTFAVASAEMPDAARAQAALTAMKTALVKNIGGKISSEKAASSASATSNSASQVSSIDLEAHGGQNGAPTLLVGHFAAQGRRIYQVIVLGNEKHITRDNVDMFINSFKLN
jgi:hypothetical protein